MDPVADSVEIYADAMQILRSVEVVFYVFLIYVLFYQNIIFSTIE